MFLCSHWSPVSSQCQELVLACFIQDRLDNSRLSSSEHGALISYHTHFSSLAVLYFYSFPVLLHSSSHVYILYFSWITNFQQAQNWLHVFESVLVFSASKAPQLIIITMIQWALDKFLIHSLIIVINCKHMRAISSLGRRHKHSF